MHENSAIINAFDRNYYFKDPITFPLKIKWRFKTDSVDRPLSQPLIHDDRIWLYAPLEKSGEPFGPAIVYEIDARSGEKIWEYTINEAGGWVSRNCVFNQMFMTSTKEKVIGLKNGRVSFTSKGESRRTKSIVCNNQHLFCSSDAGIAKLDSEGGLVKVFEKRRPTAITLSKNKIIFGASSSIYCLSADDLEIVWQTDVSEIGKHYEETKSRLLKKDIYASGKLSGRYAAISEGKVFCDVGRNVLCLNLENGDVLWKGEALGDPICAGEKIVSYDTVGNFYCLNSNTGELISKTRPVEVHGLNASVPFVSDNSFFIGTDKIIAVDISNGDLLWQYQSEQSETYFFDPVYVNGCLYTGCSDGHLYCFSQE